MIANPAVSPTRLELTRSLAVRLCQEPEAPDLARVPVVLADFADIISEAWRDHCLRDGRPDCSLADVPMRLEPILDEGSSSRCAGFNLDLTFPDGSRRRCFFTFACLRHVANRAMGSFREAEVLQPGQTCLYEVVVEPESGPAPAGATAGPALCVSVRSTPLKYLRLSLRDLLERSKPVGPQDADLPPVFYTEEAFHKAEACARRGTEAKRESGGALLGSLAACPDSGEFLAIIHDVIEVEEADETQFSLSYSSRSWHRLQAIQQARQAAYPDRAERLLGQAHGHPFRPNDGKLCAECLQRPTCTLNSAWASPDDRVWHRAVFARQPWALCHIFGLSARGEPVDRLFGLRDGHLQSRGFQILPDFTFAEPAARTEGDHSH